MEKYIEQKKKNKDKNDAYSHASEFIDKNSRRSYSVRGSNFDGRTKVAANDYLSLDHNSIEQRDDLDSDIEEEDSLDGS